MIGPIAETKTANRVILTAIILVVIGGGSSVIADELSYEKALPSVVWVLSPEGKDKVNIGTGVLIDERLGVAITAYHVVEERDEVILFFPYSNNRGELKSDPAFYIANKKELAVVGRVFARNPKNDLALIKLSEVPRTAKASPLAAESPRPGQEVFAIGNSGSNGGVLWRYIDGRVRHVYPHKMTYDSHQEVDAMLVETTVPTNHGDSGGPLFNAKGELVAIIASSHAKENAVHYGIDIKEIRAMVGPELAVTKPAKPNPVAYLAPPSPEPPVAISTAPAPVQQTRPVARIIDLHIDHEMVRDGRKGLVAHFSVSIDHAEGLPCEVYVGIFDERDKLLRASILGVPYLTRAVETYTTITPLDSIGKAQETWLFIPYDSISQALPPTQGVNRVKLKGVVNVLEVNGDRWLLKGWDATPFLFNRDLGVSVK